MGGGPKDPQKSQGYGARGGKKAGQQPGGTGDQAKGAAGTPATGDKKGATPGATAATDPLLKELADFDMQLNKLEFGPSFTPQSAAQAQLKQKRSPQNGAAGLPEPTEEQKKYREQLLKRLSAAAQYLLPDIKSKEQQDKDQKETAADQQTDQPDDTAQQKQAQAPIKLMDDKQLAELLGSVKQQLPVVTAQLTKVTAALKEKQKVAQANPQALALYQKAFMGIYTKHRAILEVIRAIGIIDPKKMPPALRFAHNAETDALTADEQALYKLEKPGNSFAQYYGLYKQFADASGALRDTLYKPAQPVDQPRPAQNT